MPTKRAPRTPQKKNTLAIYGSIVAVGLVVTMGAVLFGRSDTGQIDVTAAISNSNVERAERGEAPVAQSLGAKDKALPNGGLVGKGKGNSVQPKPEVEGTSTSTDETASSTDDGAEESGSAEGEEGGEGESSAEDISEVVEDEVVDDSETTEGGELPE